jgi:hypothetical protein
MVVGEVLSAIASRVLSRYTLISASYHIGQEDPVAHDHLPEGLIFMLRSFECCCSGVDEQMLVNELCAWYQLSAIGRKSALLGESSY